MTRRTGSLLLVLGLVAAGALVFWALDESGEDGGFELEEEAAPQRRAEGNKADDPPDVPARKDKERARDGVPRILPPDAAIEDVRDALSLVGAERERDLQAAYDAIARTVQSDADFSRNLSRYLATEDDGILRGVVLAALGARRDVANMTWLAGRLREAKTNAERIGAFLGLAHGESTVRVRCTALGGLTHRVGPLPTRRVVLEAVAGWLDRTNASAAADAVAALTFTVEQDVDVAALLVVDGKRPCKLYADLKGAARGLMRSAALKHAALPGAVRRVLEAVD